MQIVNPAFGMPTDAGEALSLNAVDWANAPIALFSNSKPNAKALLEGVRESFAAKRGINNIEHVYKDSASQPAPGDVIEDVATKYKAAILAIAD